MEWKSSNLLNSLYSKSTRLPRIKHQKLKTRNRTDLEIMMKKRSLNCLKKNL